jgi:hypothetical protein
MSKYLDREPSILNNIGMPELIYPLLTFIGFTLLYMPIASCARIRAILSGRLKIKQFKLMNLGDDEEFVTKTTRHFNNLFEVPVLFYVLILLALFIKIEGTLFVNLAWGFVFFRVIQCFIHITYNNVMHRFAAFLLSLLCLAVFFINLLLNL